HRAADVGDYPRIVERVLALAREGIRTRRSRAAWRPRASARRAAPPSRPTGWARSAGRTGSPRWPTSSAGATGSTGSGPSGGSRGEHLLVDVQPAAPLVDHLHRRPPLSAPAGRGAHLDQNPGCALRSAGAAIDGASGTRVQLLDGLSAPGCADLATRPTAAPD